MPSSRTKLSLPLLLAMAAIGTLSAVGGCASMPQVSDTSESFTEIRASIARIQADPDFEDVSRDVKALFDLRYASPRNFVGRDLYGPLKTCYLHRTAIEKLKMAAEHLEQTKPGYHLLIFDCLRPRSVQRVLKAAVSGTPQEKYVADPEQGSIHNFGFAVDLSLADDSGKELDMGTPFDFFGELAEPQLEERFLADGSLSKAQLENRKLLRSVMTEAGFIQLPYEWWHYDALVAEQVRARHMLVE